MKAETFTNNHICQYPGCNKEYSTKFALKRHSITHSQVKRFECRFWSRKFSLPQYLKEHEYIHTNETPYQCGIDGCTQSFRQRAKLWLHRKTHKSYKKKSYRTFSKKTQRNSSHAFDIRNSKIWNSVSMCNSIMQNNTWENYSWGFNGTAQGVNELNQLVNMLSSKFCLCSLTDITGKDFQQPYIWQEKPALPKAENYASDKNIGFELLSGCSPKPFYLSNFSEACSPSTISRSPTSFVSLPELENLNKHGKTLVESNLRKINTEWIFNKV